MPHLHESPGQHDLTASAFIVRTDGTEPAILLHLHRKVGVLLQFGGHVELEETPWQGLVREVREESGYEPQQYQVLQPAGTFIEDFPNSTRHPLPFHLNTHRFMQGLEHFHSDLTYAVVTDQAPAHKIGAGESSDIHAYTLAQLRALPPSKIFDQTRANSIFILESLLSNWEATPATDWIA